MPVITRRARIPRRRGRLLHGAFFSPPPPPAGAFPAVPGLARPGLMTPGMPVPSTVLPPPLQRRHGPHAPYWVRGRLRRGKHPGPPWQVRPPEAALWAAGRAAQQWSTGQAAQQWAAGRAAQQWGTGQAKNG